MLTILLAMLVVYAWRAPSSWLGRLMHGLGAAAGRRLSRVRPLTLVLFVLFVVALAALVAWAKAEGVFMAVPIGADGLAAFATVDVGAYVEVLAAAWLVSASGALRAMMQGLRAARRMSMLRAQRPRHGRRTPRAPAPRRTRALSGDDDEPATWGLQPAA